MNHLLESLAADSTKQLILNTLFQIIAILLTSLFLASFFHRNAAIRSRILCAGLILILLCPIATLFNQRHEIGLAKVDLSIFSKEAREPSFTQQTSESIAPQNEPRLTLANDQFSAQDSVELPPIPSQNHNTFQSPTTSTTPPAPSTLNWSQLLTSLYEFALILWVSGSILLLFKLFISWLRLSHLITISNEANEALKQTFAATASRMNINPNRVSIRISSTAHSPFAARILSPIVVLPASLVQRLPANKLTEIMMHELAHIARRDQAIIWLQHLAAAIYWPIPFIHLLNRQLAQAREEVCDNHVLLMHAATDYSRTLLSIAENFVPSRIPGAVGLFTSKWRLEQRIANLLDSRRQRATRLRGHLALLAALLAILPATALLVSLQWSPAIAQETATAKPLEQLPIEQLLRGSGKDLEVLLRGRVTHEQGSSLSKNLKARVTLEYNDKHTDFDAHILNGRFEVWLPINSIEWYYVGLEVTDTDGARAFQFIPKERLRQSLVDGVQLELNYPVRFIDISTILDGKALPETNVRVSLNSAATIRAKSDSNGVANIGLLENELPERITAWNDSGYIGGFSLSRKPIRDPNAEPQVVEMSSCKQLQVKLRDPDGKPAANVPFTVQVSTGKPNYNYIGVPDNAITTTDSEGNATWKWFPSWDTSHQYVALNSEDWLVTDQNTTQDCQFVAVHPPFKRKRIEGYVQSDSLPVGGVRVEMSTIQSGLKSSFDVISTTTDSSGRFYLDVLPDSTYCGFVDDVNWVSNTIDLIPYDSKKDRFQPPYLKLSKGTPVELTFTTGKDHRPFHLDSVNMDSDYNYSYVDAETGERQNSSGGRRVVSSTDAQGKIRINAPPGPLDIHAFTADWRKEETLQVVEGHPLFHTIHRESDEQVQVKGKLVADGVDSNSFAGAKVFAGSRSDGYDEEIETTATSDGSFQFTTKSSEVVVFAMSADHTRAGSIITSDLSGLLSINMRPTVPYRGRIVDEDGKPVKDHKVQASIRFEAPGAKFHAAYRPTSLHTQTNSDGEYEFSQLPSQIEVCFTADDFSDDDPNTVGMMDFITLDPDQSRPISTTTIPRKKRDPSKSNKPIDDRFAAGLSDARLGSYHLMVICFDRSNTDCQRFCNSHLIDSIDNRLYASFMHLHLNTTDEQTAGFLSKHGLPTPTGNQILAVCYNENGGELKCQIFEIDDPNAEVQADDLINASAPPKQDAHKKWAAAFEEAKKSNRRVWARTSQRFCGPCITMSRWIEQHKSILEKDFVMVKIDTFLDDGAAEYDKMLSKERLVGIPFHAMLDADGNLLIDSFGPQGNIGYVSGFDGKQHFRKMLETARVNLTDDDINQLLNSIED